MLTQITDFGVSLMQTSVQPPVLTSYKLGSGVNYVPTTTQNDIQGALVYQGVPALPVIQTTNFIQYFVELNSELGPFDFGEIALFSGPHLFAICVLDSMRHKAPLDPNTNTGGAIVITFNVPATGLNYQMWANVAQANTIKVSQVAGPEELPQSVGTAPNIYVVDSTDGVKPFLAYTDRGGQWTFDTYSSIGVTSVISAGTSTVTITKAAATTLQIQSGTQIGTMIQAASGKAYASVRWITNAVFNGNNTVTLSINAPWWTDSPISAGDLVEFYRYGSPGSTTINLSAILTIKNVSGNYTLVSGDENAVYVRVSSQSPATVYVPSDDAVNFPVGTNLLLGWSGDGQVSVAPADGTVTVITPSSYAIAQKDGKIAIVKVAPNTWELEGNLQQ
jgi:hypothetical protein